MQRVRIHESTGMLQDLTEVAGDVSIATGFIRGARLYQATGDRRTAARMGARWGAAMYMMLLSGIILVPSLFLLVFSIAQDSAGGPTTPSFGNGTQIAHDNSGSLTPLLSLFAVVGLAFLVGGIVLQVKTNQRRRQILSGFYAPPPIPGRPVITSQGTDYHPVP